MSHRLQLIVRNPVAINRELVAEGYFIQFGNQ